jgi:hypothetical protein
MNDEIDSQAVPQKGKVMHAYEWSMSDLLFLFYNGLHIILVGKVALDIICDTAFGYKVDSLHNPENELAVAFEKGANLQDGTFIQI